MQEILIEVLTQARMVWRYRWLALATAFLISLAGWIGVFMMPDVYKVSTKVFLDTTSLLRPVLKGLALDSNQRQDTVSMVRRTLLSRPNMEKVARTTDMDLNSNTPEEFEAILVKLTRTLNVRTVRGNIFNISYFNSDPKLATRVVETLLNIFVERSLGESRKDTSKTRDFLDQQIREHEAKLEAAESRLKEFKRTNFGLMPQEGQSYFKRKEEIQDVLATAKLDLEEAQKRRGALKSQLEGELPSLGDGASSTSGIPAFVSKLDSRIKSIEEGLDNMLLKYTDKHPDVIASRELLQTLQKRRDVEEGRYIQEQKAIMAEYAQGNYGGENVLENPVYQEIKISLGNAEAEVAALTARVAEYERRGVELTRLVDTVLKVESELKALNRNYSLDSKRYSALVSRRESLKLANEAEKTSDPVEFNIIEPPREPLLPSSPNRPLFNAAVLIVGFAGGIVMAWLYAMFRPAFYTKEQVMNFTDIPVIGSVIRISQAGDVTRRRLGYVAFVAGCLSLVLGLYGVIVFESNNRELINSILSRTA